MKRDGAEPTGDVVVGTAYADGFGPDAAVQCS